MNSGHPLDELEKTVQSMRENSLRPLAEEFRYPLGQRSEARGLPTVLFLGNHSSGKSTFINHLAGAVIQDTGVAPVDDGFTLITYGQVEANRDGMAVVNDPTLPFDDLQNFGKNFLQHLRLKQRPAPGLERLWLIDSPGMIDSPNRTLENERGYDFRSVVQWFATKADLVIFFFDPDKPGTTGESLRIFTEALSEVTNKLLIVMNKVDLCGDVRDFARAYGSLCWNLSRVIKTKDMPHIYCTTIEGIRGNLNSSRSISLNDFTKSTADLISEIDRVSERRADNLISDVLETARRLRVQAAVCQGVASSLSKQRWLSIFGAIVLVGLGAVLGWFSQGNTVGMSIAGLMAAIGILQWAVVGKWLAGRQFNQLRKRLDEVHQKAFEKQLLVSQHPAFLLDVWESVKPTTLKYLNSIQPEQCSYPKWCSKELKKLDALIDEQLPKLRQLFSCHDSASRSPLPTETEVPATASPEMPPGAAAASNLKKSDEKSIVAKPLEVKPTEGKTTEVRATEAKPTEVKSTETKPVETKPAGGQVRGSNAIAAQR